jgi:hypothetical protein
VGSLALVLALFAMGGQAAAQVTTCDPATSQFIVDDAAEATAVGATGYSNRLRPDHQNHSSGNPANPDPERQDDRGGGPVAR